MWNPYLVTRVGARADETDRELGGPVVGLDGRGKLGQRVGKVGRERAVDVRLERVEVNLNQLVVLGALQIESVERTEQNKLWVYDQYNIIKKNKAKGFVRVCRKKFVHRASPVTERHSNKRCQISRNHQPKGREAKQGNSSGFVAKVRSPGLSRYGKALKQEVSDLTKSSAERQRGERQNMATT
jgi:hypothetical protein